VQLRLRRRLRRQRPGLRVLDVHPRHRLHRPPPPSPRPPPPYPVDAVTVEIVTFEAVVSGTVGDWNAEDSPQRTAYANGLSDELGVPVEDITITAESATRRRLQAGGVRLTSEIVADPAVTGGVDATSISATLSNLDSNQLTTIINNNLPSDVPQVTVAEIEAPVVQLVMASPPPGPPGSVSGIMGTAALTVGDSSDNTMVMMVAAAAIGMLVVLTAFLVMKFVMNGKSQAQRPQQIISGSGLGSPRGRSHNQGFNQTPRPGSPRQMCNQYDMTTSSTAASHVPNLNFQRSGSALSHLEGQASYRGGTEMSGGAVGGRPQVKKMSPAGEVTLGELASPKQSTEERKRCKMCWKFISPNMAFCSSCGTPVPGMQQPKSPRMSPRSPPMPSHIGGVQVFKEDDLSEKSYLPSAREADRPPTFDRPRMPAAEAAYGNMPSARKPPPPSAVDEMMGTYNGEDAPDEMMATFQGDDEEDMRVKI